MKKLFFATITLIITMSLLISCNNKETSKQDALRLKDLHSNTIFTFLVDSDKNTYYNNDTVIKAYDETSGAIYIASEPIYFPNNKFDARKLVNLHWITYTKAVILEGGDDFSQKNTPLSSKPVHMDSEIGQDAGEK